MPELVLIDLSSIAHPLFHMSGSEPDQNWTSQQIVAKIHKIAAHHPHAAIACDSARSFRKELVPSYKAGRPEHDAALQHQIKLAREALAADGYPVWEAPGFEADDVIASATTWALAAAPDLTVLIASADKDLVQLVGPRVRVMSTVTGIILDEAGVIVRFGVTAAQMVDYQTLVGDAADNIKGARNIGPKIAKDLLGLHPSLDAIYAAYDKDGSSTVFKPMVLGSLAEFRERKDEVKSLITLRTEIELPFDEILTAREPAPLVAAPPPLVAEPLPPNTTDESAPARPIDQRPAGIAEPEVMALTVVPDQWERQLDPRNMQDARILAQDLFMSRMFSAYGTPQGVLSTIMLGRELGLPAMASLRLIYNMDGKHALSSALIVGLVLKSGFAEFFEPTHISETSVTFETKRKGAREPVAITYTLAQAQTAGVVKPNSNWVKDPVSMLIARCQSRLARLVYPDIAGGLYSPDELSELREARAA